MKRTASQAFGTALSSGAVPGASSSAQANGMPFMPADPQAYYTQWCMMMQQGQHGVQGQPAGSQGKPEKSEMVLKLEESSAIKCTELIKGKVETISVAAAVTALLQMATKSSQKFREELMRSATVKALAARINGLLSNKESAIFREPIEIIADASYALVRMGGQPEGSKALAVVASHKTVAPKFWHSDAMARFLWSLAKADEITKHGPLVDEIVKNILVDNRVKQFSLQSLVDMAWAICKCRHFVHFGSPTVRQGPDDEELFKKFAERIMDQVKDFTALQLCDCACHWARIGIKNRKFMDTIGEQIVKKAKDVDEPVMARTINAYRKFNFPLKEAPQGFRTMAVVVKGDFVRPSDKPMKKKQEYDKPIALHPTK